MKEEPGDAMAPALEPSSSGSSAGGGFPGDHGLRRQSTVVLSPPPLFEAVLRKSPASYSSGKWKTRAVKLYENRVAWFDPDKSHEHEIASIPLIPEATLSRNGYYLMFKSGDDYLAVTHNSADTPTAGRHQLDQFETKAVELLEALKIERQRGNAFDPEKSTTIRLIKIDKAQQKNDMRITSRFTQQGQECMWAVAERSWESLAGLRKELAQNPRYRQMKLPTFPTPGDLGAKHTRRVLETLLMDLGAHGNDPPRELLLYLGIDNGVRLKTISGQSRMEGWASVFAERGGGVFARATKNWDRAWVELTRSSAPQGVKVLWTPSRHEKDKGKGKTIMTGPDCIEVQDRQGNAIDSAYAARLGSASGVFTCLQMRGRSEEDHQRPDAIMSIDFDDQITRRACKDFIEEGDVLVPLSMPSGEECLLCSRLFWELPKSDESATSWISVSRSESNEGAVKLCAMSNIGPQLRTELELTLGVDSYARVQRGSPRKLDIHATHERRGKIDITLTLPRDRIAQKWQSTLQNQLDAIQGEIGEVGKALDAGLMRALARSRLHRKVDDPVRKLYDGLEHLESAHPAAILVKALTSKFRKFAGEFSEVQSQSGPELEGHLDAWAEFISYLLGGCALTDDIPAIGSQPTSVQAIRMVVLGWDLKPLAPQTLRLEAPMELVRMLEGWLKSSQGSAGRAILDSAHTKLLVEMLGHPSLPASTKDVTKWCRKTAVVELPALFMLDAESGMWEQCQWNATTDKQMETALTSHEKSSPNANATFKQMQNVSQQLQFRMLMHKEHVHLLHACHTVSTLSGKPSPGRIEALIDGLPTFARKASHEISLTPLRSETLKIRGIGATLALRCETKEQCSRVLRSLEEQGMLSPQMMQELIPRIWHVPLLRPSIVDKLKTALQDEEDTSAPFVKAVFDFCLSPAQLSSSRKESDSDGSRNIFECLELMLGSIGKGAEEVEDEQVPIWISEQLLPLLAKSGNGSDVIKLFCKVRLNKLLDSNKDAVSDWYEKDVVVEDRELAAKFDDTVRKPSDLVALLQGLWRLALTGCKEPGGEGMVAVFQQVAEAKSWFDVYFASNAPLREQFANMLAEILQIDEHFAKLIREGADGMMTHKRFYDWCVIKMLQSTTVRSVASRAELYYDAMQQSCRLRLFDDIDHTLQSVMSAANRDVDKMRLFIHILQAVKQKPIDYFFDMSGLNTNITLPELFECASHATDAMNIVGDLAKSKADLFRHFEHILERHRPNTWLSHFKDSATIAFFIKYIDQEDLSLAKDKFQTAVDVADDPLLRTLWSLASEAYPEPLVDLHNLDLSDDKAHATIIASVHEKAKQAESKEMQIVGEITANWMEYMIKIGNPPMTPHHTQVLAMLMFAKYFERCDKDEATRTRVHALVAQVATGEGKSMIIAMLAIYLVKAHGRKVHILENNEGLLDRDFSKNKEFFEAFDVTRDGESRPIKAADTIDNADADICYCLLAQINSAFLNGVRGGDVGLDKTVLIVDEVDDLIVDEDPTSNYVTADSEKSGRYAQFCEILKGGAPKPGGLSSEDETLWSEASAAKREADSKERNKHYVMMDGEYVMLVDGKLPRVQLTASWLVYLNYRDNGVAPSFKTHFCCVSTPYLFNAYFCIYGLTGSVGGKAEKNFLEEVYQALSFRVPLFLDTCKGTSKEPPICQEVTLHDDEDEQVRHVVQRAMQHRTEVPVLIITRDKNELVQVFKALMDDPSNSDDTSVQIFSDLNPLDDNRSMKNDWGQIVDSATRKMENGYYPVTVTDPWGGRGHDFRCLNETVNEKGGLMLLVTSIPQEREWTQWKGRTARQDRKGQFEVVLRRNDPLFNDSSSLGEACEDGMLQKESLILKLLEETDKANQQKLKQINKTLEVGQNLAKFSHKYYEKFKREDRVWPHPKWKDQDCKLRALLGKYQPSREEIDELAVHLGLRLQLGVGQRARRSLELEELQYLLQYESAGRRCAGKFGESAVAELSFGGAKDSVLPIAEFMHVDQNLISQKSTMKDEGVEEIEKEIMQHGTDDDKLCLRYVLYQETGSCERVWPNGFQMDRDRPPGLTFSDFCNLDEVKLAKLSRGMVLALRLYTTNVYISMNNPMRDLDAHFKHRKLSKQNPHPLPVTMHLLNNAIRQLRAVEAESPTRYDKVILWRGMKDVKLPPEFQKDGGTEKAPMSTTRDMKIAVQYSSSKCSIMLKIETDSFDERGADLSFLSAFKHETEVLYPPLTRLKVNGKVEEVLGEGSTKMLVVPVKPSI